MLATVIKGEEGYTARFERNLNHSVAEVWSWLTDNNKVKKWFPELSVDELRIGGIIKFDLGNGKFEKMEILNLVENSILEYTWGEDYVRFELTTNPTGRQLILTETISELTDHTPKDLAGWHVCLDVICTLIDDKPVDSKTTDWQKWYEKYNVLIDKVTEETK